jgi:hypothetical protein
MQIICLTLLLCLSSCALFKQSPSLHDKDPQELLKAVKITGEGKGRLSLGMNQYVFSVDSVLQDRNWILAVSIPLHGEEVMIFKNLNQKVLQDSETESFEERIRLEFKHRKLDKVISPERFLSELRSMVRFILASELNLKRHCDAHNSTYVCELEGEKFTISVTEKKFFIHKMLVNGHKLELVAQNLTDSFFLKNDFHLYVDKEDRPQKPAFSLELFW